KADGHRSLNVENSVLRRRLLSFRGEIDDPPAGRVASNILAHTRESRPLEIASRGNKTRDPRRRSRCAFEHFPHGPSPEIHVEVLQHIFSPSVTWLFEIICKHMAVLEAVATFDPAALSFGLVVIGRVADTHLNIGVELHL